MREGIDTMLKKKLIPICVLLSLLINMTFLQVYAATYKYPKIKNTKATISVKYEKLNSDDILLGGWTCAAHGNGHWYCVINEEDEWGDTYYYVCRDKERLCSLDDIGQGIVVIGKRIFVATKSTIYEFKDNELSKLVDGFGDKYPMIWDMSTDGKDIYITASSETITDWNGFVDTTILKVSTSGIVETVDTVTLPRDNVTVMRSAVAAGNNHLAYSLLGQGDGYNAVFVRNNTMKKEYALSDFPEREEWDEWTGKHWFNIIFYKDMLLVNNNNKFYAFKSSYKNGPLTNRMELRDTLGNILTWCVDGNAVYGCLWYGDWTTEQWFKLTITEKE